MRASSITLGLLGAALAAAPATAQPVAITSYDVTSTPAPGYGGWSHTYRGDVTDTGRILGGSASGPARIVDEQDGGGTINDGELATEVTATHLLSIATDTAGVPILPVVTLRLERPVRIGRLVVHGGFIGGNIFPGALTEATVAIGGTAAVIPATPVPGDPTSDILDLRGSALAETASDVVVLRDFSSAFSGFVLDQFSITEIEVSPADLDPPVFDDPPPSVVEAIADDPAGARVEFSVTAQDAVDGAVAVSCDPASGSVFAPLETTVICLAFDAAGNGAALNFTVRVTLTASALCELTSSYADRRRASGATVLAACRQLERASSAPTATRRRAAIRTYQALVGALARSGSIDATEAGTLVALARALQQQPVEDGAVSG